MDKPTPQMIDIKKWIAFIEKVANFECKHAIKEYCLEDLIDEAKDLIVQSDQSWVNERP